MEQKQAIFSYLLKMKEAATTNMNEAPNMVTRLAWKVATNFLDKHLIDLETLIIDERRVPID